MEEHRYTYINGDSFSEGAVYLDSPSSAWPYYLVVDGMCIINDSYGGGSNYRIFRTTVQRLSSNTHMFNNAIFGWTDISRYEYPEGSTHYAKKYHNTADHYILMENFISQVISIDKLCRGLGITPWHFYAFIIPNTKDIIDQIDRQRIENKMIQFNSLNWILPQNTTLKDWADSHTPCGHPDEESHKKFGKYVKKRLT